MVPDQALVDRGATALVAEPVGLDMMEATDPEEPAVLWLAARGSPHPVSTVVARRTVAAAAVAVAVADKGVVVAVEYVSPAVETRAAAAAVAAVQGMRRPLAKAVAAPLPYSFMVLHPARRSLIAP